MEPSDLKARLAKRLGAETRRLYLLAYAVAGLVEQDADEIADKLEAAVRRMCREANEVTEGAINMTASQVRREVKRLPEYLMDLLLINLDATLHSLLNGMDEGSSRDGDAPFEEILARRWPSDERGTKGWAYRDIILLAEVRNAIVHGDGEVDLQSRGARLYDAGWSSEELEGEPILRSRCLDDVLRMKRAVRTVANQALDRLARPE